MRVDYDQWRKNLECAAGALDYLRWMEDYISTLKEERDSLQERVTRMKEALLIVEAGFKRGNLTLGDELHVAAALAALEARDE